MSERSRFMLPGGPVCIDSRGIPGILPGRGLPIPRVLLTPICILTPSERKLMREYLGLLKKGLKRQEALLKIAESRPDKFDLTLRASLLAVEIDRILLKATKAYLNWFEEEKADFSTIGKSLNSIRKRRKERRTRARSQSTETAN